MCHTYSLVIVLFFFHGAARSDELSYKYELLDDAHTVDDIDIGAKYIALLVENSPIDFENALNFLKGVPNMNKANGYSGTDFWLITFNSSGVSAVLASSLDNKYSFYDSLEYLEFQSNPEIDLISNQSLPLFAIIHTARILPNNGAIIVFSDFVINKDKYLEQIALDSILSKNITVYAINNEENITNNVLSNILESSGGRKLNITPPYRNKNYKYTADIERNKISLIFSMKNLTNLLELPLVIGYNVTAIHITISPKTTYGCLISPKGHKYLFSNHFNQINYLQGSQFQKENWGFQLYLNFSMFNQSNLGTWMLKIENLLEPYNASVFALTTSDLPRSDAKKDYGLAKQRYTSLGKSDLYPTQTITVEVGLGSELILAAGKSGEIYFEVTNWGTSTELVTFSCSDLKYLLQKLSTYKRYLDPQESTIVTLYIDGTDGPYEDQITFSVTSKFQIVQKKVILDVGLTQPLDMIAPEIEYSYQSDCTEIWYLGCSKGAWTLEIMAKDVDSGLLKINTEPKGLQISKGYTSGTKDSVIGHYSGSCCDPELEISVVDRKNNKRTIALNAYRARLSIVAISAIVLGIFLFIIVIAVIIVVVLKKWKSKESFDLPTYKGGNI
ncbi:uncharacterized protein LOC109533822 [Dendroctonus ponderosae]|uniref:uncharacterized protein LOC109533822 n=1 Tax=Dendroctonus ponderosae TaxID=77166 RepID=UPI002034CB6E|nr:uncharacterized protein LOC109533822 [Dendroctonus ponderosae]KAH1029421.1 hypothetical protein HUJ05_002668 [Dendroctonus ponderosae]